MNQLRTDKSPCTLLAGNAQRISDVIFWTKKYVAILKISLPPPLIRNYEVYRWKGTSSTKGVRETVPNGYWGDSKYKPTQSQPDGNRETGHA